MIDFGGVIYYIDLEALDNLVSVKFPSDDGNLYITTENKKITSGENSSTEVTVTSSPRSKEIDLSKFEIIRYLLEIIIEHEDDSDQSLGPERALKGATLPFKIAFNTLIEYGIIKEKE